MQLDFFIQKPLPIPVLPVDDSRVKLRSTQPLAISLAREQIALKKKRGIIAAPCGFGKSIVACAFIEAAIKKGSKVWFVVDRQNLVNQMSAHLDSYNLGHAVMMAKHERWNPLNRVQVVSIQTVEKRGWDDDIDIMVVDECHANLRKSFLAFVERSPRTVIIGITATPFHPNIAKAYEFVVNPTTTNKQIAEGHLVPLRIFQCVEADMRGAKTSGGEWTDEEVKTRGRKIIGDIIATWIEKTKEVFGGPVKTIIFPSTIAHGQEIADAFALAGYNFQVVSCRDTTEEKEQVIADFKREDSQYDGLVSCGVLTRGFDCTDVQVGIMARPFRKAFSEFIQEIGRIQRSHTWSDGRVKEFGLLLDHAGNVGRFKDEMIDLFENGVSSLDNPPDAKPPRKEPTKKELKEMYCPRCHRLWDFKGDTCSCGFKRQRSSSLEAVPGVMQEVHLDGKGKKKATSKDKADFYQQLKGYALEKGKRDSWVAGIFKAKYSCWPNYYQSLPAAPCSADVRKYIVSRQIAYAQSKRV